MLEIFINENEEQLENYMNKLNGILDEINENLFWNKKRMIEVYGYFSSRYNAASQNSFNIILFSIILLNVIIKIFKNYLF